ERVPGAERIGRLLDPAAEQRLRLAGPLRPDQEARQEVPRLGRVRRALRGPPIVRLGLLQISGSLSENAEVDPGRSGVRVPGDDVLEGPAGAGHGATPALGDALFDRRLRVGIAEGGLPSSCALLDLGRSRGGGLQRPGRRDLGVPTGDERGEAEQRQEQPSHEPPPVPGTLVAPGVAGALGPGLGAGGCTAFAGSAWALSFATAVLTRPSGHVTSTAMAGFGSFRTG